MNKYVWVVVWNGLSVTFFTKEDAINYVNRKTKEMGARIKYHSKKFSNVFNFCCDLEGSTFEFEMYKLPI